MVKSDVHASFSPTSTNVCGYLDYNFFLGSGYGITAFQLKRVNNNDYLSSKFSLNQNILVKLKCRCRPGALFCGGRQVGAGLQLQVLEVARRCRSPIASALAAVRVVSPVVRRRRQRGDHARDGPRQSARRRRPVETEHLFDLWVQFTSYSSILCWKTPFISTT